MLVALLLLLVAVLPAEYGIDPTGIGGLLGLTKLAPQDTPGNESSNQTTSYLYRLTWPLSQTSLENRTGYTAEGSTTNLAVNIDVENVTRVAAELTWEDANETGGQRTKPDLFEIQVIGPGDRKGDADLGRNAADGRGNVSADLVWRAPPLGQTVRAETDAEAAAEAADLVEADRTGVGAWTIRITLIEAGDVDAQGVALPGPAGDQGNTWTLAVTAEAYRFDAAALNASREREDRVRIEIPAGGGLEYKFDLEEGAPLEYRWNTTGASLYYDFHGEPRGAAPGVFRSHKTGTEAVDEGSWTAPFAGTHGWYWENRNKEPVTVELITSGVYTIIGKK